MGLKDDLASTVKTIFKDRWTEREGAKVPASEDLKLGNDAVKLTATVLYADLAESTKLVDSSIPSFAAEVYKSYLHCAAKIIEAEGGVITAYDGDRIMAVFIGDTKNTSAVRASLKLNFARLDIVNPALRTQYPDSSYTIRHTVGVDTSPLYVVRTGIRGSNDLMWVGRAANYAAKLTTLSAEYPTWITDTVFSAMKDEVKLTKGQPMWEARTWTAMNGLKVHCSTWKWPIT